MGLTDSLDIKRYEVRMTAWGHGHYSIVVMAKDIDTAERRASLQLATELEIEETYIAVREVTRLG